MSNKDIRVFTVSNFDGLDWLIAVVRDISEKKNNELKIQQVTAEEGTIKRANQEKYEGESTQAMG